MKQALATAVILVGYSVSFAQNPAPKPALNGLDPVALADGKEVMGKPELTLVHGRYQYSFATKESLAAFEKNMRKHAIQMGGACARMGPMSGAGSPARFLVFENRIYVFASDICRDNFKKNPQQHIDTPDAVPTGTKDEAAMGQRLLESVLKGFGGSEKIDGIKNVQWTLPRTSGMGKDKVDGVLVTTIAFPELLRVDTNWGAWKSTYALNKAMSFEFVSDGNRLLVEDEREFLTREYYREPIALLRVRNQPGFVALAAGKSKVGETSVELLKIAYAGATSTLSVEPASGRILAISYRGRPSMGPIGTIEKTFGDFKAVQGVMLPHTVRTTWEGKSIPTLSGTYSTVQISQTLDADFFRASVAK